MPDLYAISQAIAGRYAPGLVTPPSGMQNIRVSTAGDPGRPLNAMPPLPCMIVYAGTGTRDVNRNTTRIMDHRFVARFYYSQAGDIARDAAAVQRWTTVLVDQLRGAVQFGGTVPSVTRASVDGYSIGYLRFADKDYAGVELQVGVTTSEPWQAVA